MCLISDSRTSFQTAVPSFQVTTLVSGNCTLAEGASAPHCVCRHGFTGSACDACRVNFDPATGCQSCVQYFIGFDTDCSKLCVNGHATQPGIVFDCIALYCIVLCCVASRRVASRRVTPRHVTSCRVASHRIACRMIFTFPNYST